MEDRELLALAARAAGIDHRRLPDAWPERFDDDQWNPLIDDGDALRLAVRLGFFLELYTDDVCLKDRSGSVTVRGFINIDEDGVNVDEVFNVGDPYAATRRAIVRAAAGIGKGMP